jgi:hypothetical protein
MVQLNKSDSTTSLSELTIIDTACVFCKNPEDIEGGKRLIDGRIFLSCECRITIHLDCWKEYISEHSGTLACPSCERHAPTWKQPDLNTTELHEHKKRNYVREIAIVFFVITIIFFIAFTLVYLQK